MKRQHVWIVLLILLLTLTGCGGQEKKTVELNFDKQTAYFTSSVKLSPIAGEIPSAGEAVERATVKLSAT